MTKQWPMILVLATAALCAPTVPAYSQAPLGAGAADTLGRLAGDVVDAATHLPVTLARVLLRSGSDGVSHAATTDLQGRFVIRGLRAATYTLEVRRIGYTPLTRTDVRVGASEHVALSLSLTAVAFRLAAVTVAPGSYALLGSGPAVRQTLSRSAIESAPFGEDLFRAMNHLPGLTSGDYGAQFSIQRKC